VPLRLPPEATSKARLIRDNSLPILYVDIKAGVPHTYRLELYGNSLYVWYIDSQTVDAGMPEGAFPTGPTEVISFRANSWYLDNTVWWDYIRYGTIPGDGSGDFDSDQDLDSTDWYFMQECLGNAGPDVDAGPGCRFADFDADTDVDLADFAAFQAALSSGG